MKSSSRSLSLVGCTLKANVALTYGGALYNAGTASLTSCTVSGSSASNGGGLFNASSTTSLRNTLNLVGCTLSGNRAPNGGGGLTNGGTVNVTNCTLSANTAPSGGGGAINTVGELTLLNCTLSGNSGYYGGGIYSLTNLTGNTTTVRNSTLSGNSAISEGGGLVNARGKTVIGNSTITNNRAPGAKGGGLASTGDSQTSTQVSNTILVGNTDMDVAVVNGSAKTYTSGGYNLLGTGPSAFNDFNAPGDRTRVTATQVNLDTLKNNGGPTFTHALLLGSIAIDASGGSGPTLDQRGYPRVGRRDIGAFEFSGRVPSQQLAIFPRVQPNDRIFFVGLG